MSEIGEKSETPDIQRSLTVKEILSIRTDERVGRSIVYRYKTADRTVSTTFVSPSIDRMSDNEREAILKFLRSRQNGEGYRYEPLVVNSLLRQFQIGQRFGLNRDSLYTDFKLNVENKGSILVDDWGHVYLRVLDEHVNILRRQGATEEQLITELAGHIFHESIHNAEDNMREVLFNGKDPFGEIATITAQMAYYLDEGYTGPTAYTQQQFKAGFNKIQAGRTNSRDYDIATYVSVSLILQSLKETYPTFLPKAEKIDPISACRTIVSKLSPNERRNLIPTLKKAIVNSADERVFEDILDKTRRKKEEKVVHDELTES